MNKTFHFHPMVSTGATFCELGVNETCNYDVMDMKFFSCMNLPGIGFFFMNYFLINITY